MLRRFIVTLSGILAFLIATHLPLPFVDANAFEELSRAAPEVVSMTSGRTSLVALGIEPFVVGFLLVELFSLLTAPGRRLRHGGIDGRRTLNRAALGVSTLTALVQASGIALFWTGLSAPGGAPLTTGPASLLCITLMAGAFATAGLAEVISRQGLGNGFAVLMVAPTLPRLLEAFARRSAGDPTILPETRIMSLIWAALFVAVIVAFVLRRPTTRLEARLAATDAGSLPYRLPPVPQGVLALSWTYAVIGLLTQSWGGIGPLVRPGFWAYYGLAAVLILALSVLTGWMFTARPRVEANLAGLECVPAEGYDRAWWRQLALAAVVLAVGEAGLAVLPKLISGVNPAILPLTALLPLVVVVLDLVDMAKLASSTPLERVLTLDNVHLAEYLHARLGEEGIACVISSFRFRRLLYLFGPLFKMVLLVPAADRERAEQLVQETPFEIV